MGGKQDTSYADAVRRSRPSTMLSLRKHPQKNNGMTGQKASSSNPFPSLNHPSANGRAAQHHHHPLKTYGGPPILSYAKAAIKPPIISPQASQAPGNEPLGASENAYSDSGNPGNDNPPENQTARPAEESKSGPNGQPTTDQQPSQPNGTKARPAIAVAVPDLSLLNTRKKQPSYSEPVSPVKSEREEGAEISQNVKSDFAKMRWSKSKRIRLGLKPSKNEHGTVTANTFDGKTIGDGDEIIPVHQQRHNKSGKKAGYAAASPAPSAAASNATSNKTGKQAVSEKKVMFRALEQGNIMLWNSPFGWDILIICQDQTWQVHRSILCEESDWMAENMPPVWPGGRPTQWVLNSHHPGQLGNALLFMYAKRAVLDPDDPLNLSPILTNVAMYIAGASVGCRAMKNFAMRHIDESTDVLKGIMPVLYVRFNSLSFYEWPLRRALFLMYDQPDAALMAPLRLAMARLVDVTLMYAILDRRFRLDFDDLWPPIAMRVAADNDFFARAGLLLPLEAAGGGPVASDEWDDDEGSQEGTVVGEDRGYEGPEFEASRSS